MATAQEVKELEDAFTKTQYLGNAHVKFAQYLRRCYNAYDITEFKAPCVTVTQSSGFGKSRMIRELAVKAKDDEDLNMKVLYTCTHNARDVAERLKAIFYHATENWDTVQTEWLGLFTDTAAEDRVAKALGETLKSENAKPTDYSAQPSGGKMVLVVFDEARNLLKHPTTGSNYVDVLQNALVSANIDIGNKGRIFGVLVDTNPRITDPSPSSRRTNTRDRRSFQPFVLTHSMDAKWQQYCRDKLEEVRGVPMDTGGGGDEDEVSMSDQLVVYKSIVEGNDEKGAWDALKRMGRPLWTDLCKDWRDDKVKLVSFAACKLMLGVSPWQKSNFTVDTMFGVASMLCRLGVRPRWTSEIAPLFVANFMATLAYVNYEGNAFLSSYASEPVLMFGAVSVWYALDNGLGKYILPQLKKLISSEVLDTDGVEKIAARILMLLAMDQCLMNSYDINDRLIGQLVSVGKFLEVLRVGEMQIFSEEEETPSEVERPAFNQWLLKWEGWYVGFTHFVELVKEPSEDFVEYAGASSCWCNPTRRRRS